MQETLYLYASLLALATNLTKKKQVEALLEAFLLQPTWCHRPILLLLTQPWMHQDWCVTIYSHHCASPPPPPQPLNVKVVMGRLRYYDYMGLIDLLYCPFPSHSPFSLNIFFFLLPQPKQSKSTRGHNLLDTSHTIEYSIQSRASSTHIHSTTGQ